MFAAATGAAPWLCAGVVLIVLVVVSPLIVIVCMVGRRAEPKDLADVLRAFSSVIAAAVGFMPWRRW